MGDIVSHFLELPVSRRRKIMIGLGIKLNYELPEPKRYTEAFKTIRENELMGKFEALLEETQ